MTMPLVWDAATYGDRSGTSVVPTTEGSPSGSPDQRSMRALRMHVPLYQDTLRGFY